MDFLCAGYILPQCKPVYFGRFEYINGKVMIWRSFLFLGMLVSFSCTDGSEGTAVAEAGTNAEAYISEDEKAINEAVLNAYAAITFEAGAAPDYDAIRAVFMPQTTMYNFRTDSLAAFGLDDFVAALEGVVENGQMTAFSEIELGGETEYFGNIGHRISAYASYFDGSGVVGERGVNSFQLLKVNGTWRINSVVWDVEKDGQPIPDRYVTE